MWRGVAVASTTAVILVGCGDERAHTTLAAQQRSKPQFRLALRAPTHTPRVGSKWWYVVRASDRNGAPLRARLTVEVVDPLGVAHPAEVGTSKRKLIDYPFIGRYRDFARWPPAARGYRLVFRVTVAARGARRTVRYWVRPR